MLFLDILKDSFKYPSKNFRIVLVLGVICLLSDLSGHMLMITTNEKIIFPLGILSLLIGVFGCGYLFQISKRTLEGDPNPPLFDDWKTILFDGFKVFSVIIIYLVPVILTILYFMKIHPFCFAPFFEGLSPLTVAGLMLGRFYWLGIPDLMMLLFDTLPATPIGFFGIVYLVMVLPLMFVSLVHMINNDGKLQKAFSFIEIIYKIQKIQKTRLLTWYILIGFTYLTIITSLFYANFVLPIQLLLLLGWLICLIINPYLYMFMARSITLLYKSKKLNP